MALLAGKLAFVTGAGSGIGRAACLSLAREGAQIIAADLNENAAKETLSNISGKCLSLAVNVADLNEVEAAFNRANSYFGRVPNVTVNCAGIIKDSFIHSQTLEQFKQVIDVNLTGTFIVTKVACAKMVEAGITGSLINISSIVARMGNIGQANYVASKAGVEAMTITASREMGRYGIRCNTIMPGFIETPMTEDIPDKVKSMLLSRVALGRMGTAEEIAEVIMFLASDRSSYISGATIPVTGGL